MSAAHHQPKLHLVGAENASAAAWALPARQERAAREVAAENFAAAHQPQLDPSDPRWVMAVRASTSLQGSVLSPERRASLMRTASLLGVRPFDANVIIAIVQDQARRGGSLPAAAPLVAMVPDPALIRRQALRAEWIRWAAALAAAMALNAALIWWLTR